MMPQNNTALTYKTGRRSAISAFTLIELLIVIALTGLLLTLILGPLLQGFNLTNRARALTEAQDANRFGIEQLKRELSQASYVFDNTNAPIVLPLSNSVSDERAQRYPNVYSAQPGNPRPSILFAKIDFIPVATAGEGTNTKIDPTTDKPLGGSPLLLPVAPGRRYVRYFVGLRQPFTISQNGNFVPGYYSNNYEFKRTDNTFNSFILWRAEFNPDDPNLVNPNAGPYQLDGGGLHDPDFFYNANVAPNGRTYAENWRAVSAPVVAAPNIDLISWRRNQAQELVAGSPFQILLNFTPSSIAGDTGTPGYISNVSGQETSAPPSLYTAQYGQWTLPFTVTAYRASLQNSGTSPNFGKIQFTVARVQASAGDPYSTKLQVTLSPNGPVGNSIFPAGTTQAPTYYWLYDDTTGRLFIHTAKLTFFVDPALGRIETAIPPLATQPGASQLEAVPLYFPGGDTSNAPIKMVAGPDGNFGKLATTYLRQSTLRQGAGTTLLGNAGILETNLAIASYINPEQPGTAYASPFTTMMVPGSTTSWYSIMVTPGSDKVVGPDAPFVNSANPNSVLMTTYYRQPIVGTTLAKPSNTKTVTDPSQHDVFVRTGTPDYQLETTAEFYAAPLLRFDIAGANPNDAPGLPARDIVAGQPDGFIEVNYRWQNNFARDAAGRPINYRGQYIGSGDAGNGLSFLTGNDYRPEADVFKIDYATRSQISILLGARVFDTSTGTPQTAQVSSLVNVGNVAR